VLPEIPPLGGAVPELVNGAPVIASETLVNVTHYFMEFDCRGIELLAEVASTAAVMLANPVA
jgi:hypothetical protein